MNKNGLQDEVGMLDPAELDFDPARLAVERMAGLVLDTTEAGIRAKLIALGWTPPEWQPIDTAPRDGTAVLLAQRDPDFPLQGDEGAWYQFTGSFKHGGWYCDEYDAFEKRPTHWKSLGQNPEEA